jgi:hypothetical protein
MNFVNIRDGQVTALKYMIDNLNEAFGPGSHYIITQAIMHSWVSPAVGQFLFHLSSSLDSKHSHWLASDSLVGSLLTIQ